MLRFTTCGLTILLAFAPAALAVDGTVLINQSTLTNGLTGCPTGGHFPIIICQSGSYRLSGSLTVPDANTDAIDINVDNVTLDLNGFAIVGPAKCQAGTYPVQCSTTGTGSGIFSGNANISLSNGTISGMGSTGILLEGFGARIDGLRIESNAGASGAGGIVASGDAIISNCRVRANALNGIVVSGAATVNHNTVIFNGGFGIVGFVGGQAGGEAIVASDNSVANNGLDGMNNVQLAVNNAIVANVGFGFACPGGGCSFEGNVILSNQGGVSTRNSTSLGHNNCGGTVC